MDPLLEPFNKPAYPNDPAKFAVAQLFAQTAQRLLELMEKDERRVVTLAKLKQARDIALGVR